MTWNEGKYFNGTRGISYVLLYHPIALISNFCHAQDLMALFASILLCKILNTKHWKRTYKVNTMWLSWCKIKTEGNADDLLLILRYWDR